MMLSADDAPALPLWINGHAYLTVVERFYDIIDRKSGATLRRTPLCAADTADEAVLASKQALANWSQTPAASRQACLAKVAESLTGYTQHFSKLLQEETLQDEAAAGREISAAIDVFSALASTPCQAAAPQVLALIIDDSAPLLGAASLIAPALATGHSVIVKPSPKAPSCALALVELITRAGVADGVCNLVHGDDDVIKALCTHAGVAALAFSGNSLLAGKIGLLAEAAGKPFLAERLTQR